MIGGKGKGQIALEFIIVYSIVLLIFVIIFALVVNQRASSLSSDEYQSLQLAAQNIAIHLDQAIIAGNGYSAIVPIPPVSSTNPYRLFVSTAGVVEANVTIGITKSEAIAYSSAKDLVINGTEIANSNGIYLYNVSTYTGSIEITNSGGIVYIDEAPPSSSFLADSMYIKSKGTTEAAHFNGNSGSIFTSGYSSPQSAITIVGWIYPSGFTNGNGIQYWWTNGVGDGAIGAQSYPNNYPDYTATDLEFFIHNASNTGYGCGIGGLNLNTWYFVAEVVNGTNAKLYLDGQTGQNCTFTYSNPGTESNLTIGAYGLGDGPGGVMDGDEADVQFYDAVLSGNEIQTLYQEGIADTPVNSSGLIGWWPLNGNANDYSGNGNNGAPYNISYANVNELKVHMAYENGDSAPSVITGLVTNAGAEVATPNYMQPNPIYNYIAGRTYIDGNITYFTTANGSVPKITGDVFAFNGNLSTEMNLSGWWPLEFSTGKTAYDFSGHYNNGVFTGNGVNWALYASTGTNFMLAHFNGASSYDNATTAETYSRSITISAWVNNTGTGNYWQNIAEVSGEPYTSETFDIGITAANGQAAARWNNNADSLTGGSASAPQPSGGVLAANTLYLVTGVWNGANDTITVYIDGKPVATSAGNGTYATAIGKINIGIAYPGMSSFSGTISNVQVYNTSLQQSYIEQIYENGVTGAPISNAGLVGWFPLDGNGNDYSTNNYPVKSNSITYSNTEYVNSFVNSTDFVASFNGTNGYINDASPKLPTSMPVTIAAWVNPKSYQNSLYGLGVVAGWGAASAGNTIALDLENDGQLYAMDMGGDCAVALEAKPNAWSFITLSVSTSDVASFFINGQTANCTMSTLPTPPSENLGIGGIYGTRNFNGSIADVQIYNTTLTHYQIEQLYDAGLPLKESFNASFS